MKREMTLCLRCSGLYKDTFKVTEVPGTSARATCNHCGKKIYCSKYIIEGKGKTNE